MPDQESRWALTFGLIVWQLSSVLWEAITTLIVHVIGTAEEDRVICMGLDMLLEVLGAFERFAAEVTSMRLQGNMDANMRGNVITLDHGDVAVRPSTLQVQIVCAFATDVNFADVVLDRCQSCQRMTKWSRIRRGLRHSEFALGSLARGTGRGHCYCCCYCCCCRWKCWKSAAANLVTQRQQTAADLEPMAAAVAQAQ